MTNEEAERRAHIILGVGGLPMILDRDQGDARQCALMIATSLEPFALDALERATRLLANMIKRPLHVSYALEIVHRLQRHEVDMRDPSKVDIQPATTPCTIPWVDDDGRVVGPKPDRSIPRSPVFCRVCDDSGEECAIRDGSPVVNSCRGCWQIERKALMSIVVRLARRGVFDPAVGSLEQEARDLLATKG